MTRPLMLCARHTSESLVIRCGCSSVTSDTYAAGVDCGSNRISLGIKLRQAHTHTRITGAPRHPDNNGVHGHHAHYGERDADGCTGVRTLPAGMGALL